MNISEFNKIVEENTDCKFIFKLSMSVPEKILEKRSYSFPFDFMELEVININSYIDLKLSPNSLLNYDELKELLNGNNLTTILKCKISLSDEIIEEYELQNYMNSGHLICRIDNYDQSFSEKEVVFQLEIDD